MRLAISKSSTKLEPILKARKRISKQLQLAKSKGSTVTTPVSAAVAEPEKRHTKKLQQMQKQLEELQQEFNKVDHYGTVTLAQEAPTDPAHHCGILHPEQRFRGFMYRDRSDQAEALQAKLASGRIAGNKAVHIYMSKTEDSLPSF